jgi:Zn-dependent metalloprotease/fibronectin type 3 domain-containing protein
MRLFRVAACVLGVAVAASAQPPVRPEPVHRRLPAGAVLRHAPSAVSAARPLQPAADAAVSELLADLRVPGAPSVSALAAAGEAPRLGRTPEGFLRAIGAPGPARFIVRTAQPGDDAPALAAKFLQLHAAAFGIDGAPLGFGEPRITARGDRTYVRLPQTYDGVPVLGGAAVVQLDAAGGVQFVLGTVGRRSRLPVSDRLPVVPRVGADAAVELARALVSERYGVAAWASREPELAVYEPSLFGNAGPARLVWRVKVVSAEPWIGELVLVDADSAEVVFHFSEIATALNRTIRNANNVVGSTGTVARSEGSGPTGDAEVDAMYNFCGDTYAFYSAQVGQDSIDGAGLPIEAHVRYCSSGADCPMHNAFWSDSTEKTYFGEGTATDDIVAHELTHGVTYFAGGLFYWNETGAINESMSDVFGELTDLTNGAGLDAPANRWQMGEGSSLGVIRSMSDPTLHGHPDRRFSPLWHVALSDNRGVHTNSGVGNKLAYLLVDGDTFRGFTIAGMGVAPVADLYDEVLQNLLTPSSTYHDLYEAITQAAINLGWSQAWRNNLESACRAVQIAAASAPVTILSESFEGAFPGAAWDLYTPSGTDWGTTTFRAAGGSKSAWCAAAGANPGPVGGPYVANQESWMIYGPFSLVDAAQAVLTFDFWLKTEGGFDTFAYLASTNGVDFVGRSISGDLSEWVPEVLNLNDLSELQTIGQPQVWIAFLFQADSALQFEGVYVDNVLLTRFPCSNPPSAPALTAPATAPTGQQFTVSWTATGYDTYLLDEATNASFTGATTYQVLGTSKTFVRSGSGTTFHYRARALNECGEPSPNSNTAQTAIGAACTQAGISTHPANKSIQSGQTTSLSVVASGTAPFTYQWYQGTSGNTASPIGGATSSGYTTPALAATTSYWVRVSNGCGVANSNTATVTVSGTVPTKFDFGTTTSPVAASYTRVAPNTAFSVAPALSVSALAAAGYGWVSGTIDARDRATGGDLNRDFNFTPLGTFAVNVANGAYNVTMNMGDATAAHDQMGVFIEGSKLDSATTAANQFAVKVFRGVTIADGQLTLLLDDEGGTDPNVVINSLELTPATPRKFDFGTTTSPVAGGFVRVANTTTYTAQLGYGWLSGTIASRDRATGGDLNRDFNFTPLGTFQVTLPNGTYNVRLTIGDATGAHEQMGIYMEGVLKDTLSTAVNQFLVKTYSVTVSDGQLTVLLDDLGGADVNVVLNALEVL